MAGAGDGDRRWFSACAGGCPWCFTCQLLSTEWEKGEIPAWALRAGVHFSSGVEGNTFGEGWIRARDTVRLSWLGQHARLGEMGTKVRSQESPLRVPDQEGHRKDPRACSQKAL